MVPYQETGGKLMTKSKKAREHDVHAAKDKKNMILLGITVVIILGLILV
jgi:hypothetical protein